MKIIPVLVFPLLLLRAAPLTAGPLEDAEALLQSRKYSEAAEMLAAIPPAEREKGYAPWLRAVALNGAGKPAEVVAASDAVPADSRWSRKARLLKAKALTDQKKHAEAEAIYAEEAARALSSARKDEIAGKLASFADEVSREPAAGEIDAPPPDIGRAAALYRQALEVEFLTPGFLDETLYKLAVSLQKLGQHQNALTVLNDYLVQFDKDWVPRTAAAQQPQNNEPGAQGEMGPVRERPREAKRFIQAGIHTRDARLRMAESQLATGDAAGARRTAEELIAIIGQIPEAERAAAGPMLASAAWLRCRTFGAVRGGGQNFQAAAQQVNGNAIDNLMQQGTFIPSGDSTRHNEALRAFLAAHPADVHAPDAADLIAENLLNLGRTDDGIAALQAFIEGKGYQFDPAAEANRKADPGTGLTPAEALERRRQDAFFRIAQLEFGRKRYAEAIAKWRGYTVNYPNGAQWAAAQQGMIDAEFQLGIEAVASGDEKLARERFDAFLTRYPLDQRARQILFIYGQFAYASALSLEITAKEKDADAGLPQETVDLFRSAMDQWARLIAKYPQSEEASLALYNTALILSEKLDRLEEGLAAFRRLNWGQWAQAARERAGILEEKSLAISAPRVFRTDEVPHLLLSVRNIKKVKVSRYALDLEGWLRSAHRLGGLDKLDVDLIAPEKTWEVEVAGFSRWRSLQQKIELPFPENAGGACVVRVEGDDWQATTLVVRSDIEIISEATRGELLVFALNAREKKPAAGATVLVSDGTKLIATGVTGADGIFRHRADALPNTTRAFVLTPQGAMVSGLDLSVLTTTKPPPASTHTTFDRSSYLPGQTARFIILRRLADSKRLSPDKGKVTLRILDPEDRLVRAGPAEWAADGTISSGFNIPASAPEGTYKVQLLDKDEKIFVRSQFEVVQPADRNTPQLTLKLDHTSVVPGETITATLQADWPWGLPLADEEVDITFPGGQTERKKTDAGGTLVFDFKAPSGDDAHTRQWYVSLRMPKQSRSCTVSGSFGVNLYPWNITLLRPRGIVPQGEPLDLKLLVKDHRGNPESRLVKAALYRLNAPPPSRVLEGVPWISYSPPAAAEEKVEEFTLTTDAGTGRADHALKNPGGGFFVLRLSGDEGKTTAEHRFFVSGGTDPHELRIFTEKNVADEGTVAKLRLQSGRAFEHVLVTVSAGQFLSSQVIAVQPGMTEIPVTVSAEHAPGFRVTAVAVSGRTTSAASASLSVRRGLKIALTPGEGVGYRVTDLAGNPVEGTVTLASAVQTSPDPDAIFAWAYYAPWDVLRTEQAADLRLAVHTSAALLFPGTSVRITSATGSSGEQKQLIANDQERLLKVQQVELSFNGGNSLLFDNYNRALSASCFVQMDAPGSRASGPLIFAEGVRRSVDAWVQSSVLPVVPDSSEAELITDDETPVIYMPDARLGWLFKGSDGSQTAGGDGVQSIQTIRPFPYPTEIDPPQIQQSFGNAASANDANGSDSIGDGQLWQVTPGAEGRITGDGLKAGRWTATIRAWAPGTGMVQMSYPLVRREPVSVETVRTLLLVTNRDGLDGEAEVTDSRPGTAVSKFTLQKDRLRTLVHLEKWNGESALNIKLPGGNVIAVQPPAAAKPVNPAPWLTQAAGGVLGETDELILQLPGIAKEQLRLSARVFPDPDALIAAMSRQEAGAAPAAELLSLITRIQRLRAGTDQDKAEAGLLLPRAVDLVSELALLENGGGWAWGSLEIDPDILSTAQTWWAMRAAALAGITVSEKLRGRVEAFMEANYAGIPADDYEKKAAVLHAMAVAGTADYANAAPLLRVRESLSDCALAFLTAALVRMDRPEEGQMLLQMLEQRAVRGKSGAKLETVSWKGSTRIVRLSEPELVTSMALWCYARLQPSSATGAAAVNWMLSSRALSPDGGSHAGGPVTVALDAWFTGENDWNDGGYVLFTDSQGEVAPGADLTDLVLRPADGENRVRVRSRDAKRALFSVILSGSPLNPPDPKPWAHPDITGRKYFHDSIYYGDALLNVPSTSPVKTAELGQRVRVEVRLRSTEPGVAGHPQYLVWNEPIPAGFGLVPGSLDGNWDKIEILPQHLRLTYGPGVIEPLRYQIVALTPGESTARPSVISDAYDPSKYRPGSAAAFTVLKPGEKSPDPYEMNQAEHFELAKRTFSGGNSEECLKHLDALASASRKPEFEKDLARMRLWLLTDKPDGDAAQIVQAFETLNERHPSLVIPFDRILRVGEGYRKIGEHERGAYVFSAALDANFLTDAGVSAALEDNGDYVGSVDFMEQLWLDSPDSSDPRSAFFALSQSLFSKAGEAEKIPVRRGQKKPEKNALLSRSRDLLQRFATLYPGDELADDAAFSLTNAFFALKDYPGVVAAAEAAVQRHPQSAFLGQFQYMAALGHFWQFHFDQALASAAPVANGETKDRDLARYITGQIHHAQGKPAEAVEWYRKVKAKYPDAADALAAFEEKRIVLPEIATFKPGEDVKLSVNHRNVKEASLQIYKVDLMKLYLREKNLSRVTRVNLAGIAPEAAVPVPLANAAPWTDLKLDVTLPMKEEGAYLVIARGDDLFTSGLVLITALRLDVREDASAGSVRVNVLSAADGKYVADAEVKAIATGSTEIQSGQTDPRGIFEAAGLRGLATVIVRQGENRFAFHRGVIDLAPPPVTPASAPAVPGQFDPPQIPQIFGNPGKVLSKDAYLENISSGNNELQKSNLGEWDQKRRSGGKGVQADKALKK